MIALSLALVVNIMFIKSVTCANLAQISDLFYASMCKHCHVKAVFSN